MFSTMLQFLVLQQKHHVNLPKKKKPLTSTTKEKVSQNTKQKTNNNL